jgi:hypothetical protein
VPLGIGGDGGGSGGGDDRAAGLAAAAPAAASPINLVDCNANHHALQPAIDGAAQGETLLVTGTCTGPFTISNNLTLNGIGQAVLDGNHAGRTVTVGSGARVHLDYLISVKRSGWGYQQRRKRNPDGKPLNGDGQLLTGCWRRHQQQRLAHSA